MTMHNQDYRKRVYDYDAPKMDIRDVDITKLTRMCPADVAKLHHYEPSNFNVMHVRTGSTATAIVKMILGIGGAMRATALFTHKIVILT